MESEKVRAYGGLFSVTKRQYIITQSVVFAVLGALLLATFLHDLDSLFFGHARLVIGVIALFEIGEMVYIFRKFGTHES
jgi:hypothetical protein